VSLHSQEEKKEGLKCFSFSSRQILSKSNLDVMNGAVCLDGTPPAYYIDYSKTNSRVWVVMFQGGGWAYTQEDAKSRSTGSLGSSAKAATSYTFTQGPLSSDQNMNPTFYNANRVYLLYCDGGSWTGDLDEPLNVDGTKVFIRGKRVLDALFNALLADEGMFLATDVLLSGTSAGALASILHADYIQTLLPNTVVRYGVLPISGFFLNHEDLGGSLTYGGEMRNVFEYQNSTFGVNSACIEGKTMNGTALTSDCMFANETIAVTTSPMFLLNSYVDSWQLQNIWIDTSNDCVTNIDAQFQKCTDSQVIDKSRRENAVA
jgi:hypothetical protein